MPTADDGAAIDLSTLPAEAAVDFASAMLDAGDAGDASVATDASDASDGSDAGAVGDASAAPDGAVPLGDIALISNTRLVGRFSRGRAIVMARASSSTTTTPSTCGPVRPGVGAWDYIRYRHSSDNGSTWSPDQIVLEPTPGSRDAVFRLAIPASSSSARIITLVTLRRKTRPAPRISSTWRAAPWQSGLSANGMAPGGVAIRSPSFRTTAPPIDIGIGEPSLVLGADQLFSILHQY